MLILWDLPQVVGASKFQHEPGALEHRRSSAMKLPGAIGVLEWADTHMSQGLGSQTLTENLEPKMPLEATGTNRHWGDPGALVCGSL